LLFGARLKMPHATNSNGVRIVPIVHGKDKDGLDFGAEVYGVDLNNFTGNCPRKSVFKSITKLMEDR
jgi:hypothetical protein